VSKLELAKTTVISNKHHRDEIKAKRMEYQVHL
jgi:ACT domain-containing protein